MMNENKISCTPQLRLVAWELTRSCILNCRHCRASALRKEYSDEFTTDECFSVLDSLSDMGQCIVIMTGGEPLLRKDIFEIASYGNSKGLRMVLATCGTLLDADMCSKLINSGIARISLSIDGATDEKHDDFRGVDGAFAGLMRGIDAARAAGLEFQINTTITKTNLKDLPDIYSLAVKLGAASFHPFLLVPIGRAGEMIDEMITPDEYESTLNWIYEKQLTSDIAVKPTCAPHYYRIYRERENDAGRVVKRETHGLNALTKGCLGGQGFAFISHTGSVQICGFLEEKAGDLRVAGYNFKTVWETSELFKKVRAVNDYHGKCGYCEYRNVCGGCRARAYAISGDYLGEEPQCLYKPKTDKQN